MRDNVVLDFGFLENMGCIFFYKQMFWSLLGFVVNYSILLILDFCFGDYKFMEVHVIKNNIRTVTLTPIYIAHRNNSPAALTPS